MTLYELSGQFQAFYNAVEAGEIPEEAIADTLELLEGEFDLKADNLACMVKQLRADAQAIKEQEQALRQRREAKERRAEYFAGLLSEGMQRVGRERIETARNLLTFRKSTGLQIADEAEFKRRHRELCQVEEVVKIPRKIITDLIKEGAEIPGATLETRQNLQIK